MIWSVVGAILTLAGSAGAGVCICRERQQRIRQLTLFSRVFTLIAGEVGYGRIPMPGIFLEVSGKLEAQPDALGEMLFRVGQRLEDGSGQGLDRIWREELEPFLSQTGLREPEKERILSFPHAVWYPDGQRQQEAVVAFAKEMEETAQTARLALREENRMTMALSLAAGALAAILLV